MSDFDFKHTDSPEPHRGRTKMILQAHPEVRELLGNNPWTFLILLGVVATQTAIAFVLRDAPWWMVLLLAYLVGAFASHALFVLIHEAGHNLIFKKKPANRLAGILADMANVVPSSVSFAAYHQKHHAYQGDYYRDADLAFRWEARLIGRSFVKKALWLLLFPIVEGIRPMRIQGVKFLTGWTVLNWLIVFAFDGFILFVFGPLSLLYLVASLFFGIGLHPVGARWIQEHYLVAPPQETYSYYGIVNIPSLNVGYHNEHHDFPSIPWNRLPELKRRAPESYDTLHSHKSYVRLLWRFLTDPELTLFSRYVRTYS